MITSGPRRKKDGGARRLDSFPRWRRSISLPPSSPPPPPPLATSLDVRWGKKDGGAFPLGSFQDGADHSPFLRLLLLLLHWLRLSTFDGGKEEDEKKIFRTSISAPLPSSSLGDGDWGICIIFVLFVFRFCFITMGRDAYTFHFLSLSRFFVLFSFSFSLSLFFSFSLLFLSLSLVLSLGLSRFSFVFFWFLFPSVSILFFCFTPCVFGRVISCVLILLLIGRFY